MAIVVGTNAGFVTSSPSADPAGTITAIDAKAVAFLDTAPATAIRVIEIGIWIDNATQAADFEFGIYTDNAVDNEPEALVGSKVTIAKGTTSGWKSQSCNIAITAGTDYWIALQLDNTATGTNANWAVVAGEFARKDTPAQTALTDPWGTSDGLLARRFAIYAKWEAAPAGAAGIMTPNSGFWGPTF